MNIKPMYEEALSDLDKLDRGTAVLRQQLHAGIANAHTLTGDQLPKALENLQGIRSKIYAALARIF